MLSGDAEVENLDIIARPGAAGQREPGGRDGIDQLDFTAGTGHMRRHTPNAARRATSSVATMTPLRSSSDQVPAIGSNSGRMRPSTNETAVKVACASTGNATNTMMVLAAIVPSTRPWCRTPLRPDPSVLRHAHARAPHLQRS